MYMVESYSILCLYVEVLSALKVGSCPNDDIFVQIFFYPFLCSIYMFLFSESVSAKKSARFC